MREWLLIILFIGFWLIELKKKRDIIEKNSLYISLLTYLLDRSYEFVPDEQEELLKQIEEVLYDKDSIED